MAEILLVVCHPEPLSFNHTLASRLREELERAGHSVLMHDLYAEGFDPVLGSDELRRRFSFDPDVQEYYGLIGKSAGIVIVHPDWWSQPPALLVGWVDRVFRPGITYEYEGELYEPKHLVKLLTGKKAFVFCTSDTGPRRRARHPLSRLWKEGIFGYCGAETTVRIFSPFREAGRIQKDRWIREAVSSVLSAFAT